MNILSSLGALTIGLAFCQPATAAIITYAIGGTVSVINIDNVFQSSLGGINVGMRYDATFRFDNSAPEGSGFVSDPTAGSYPQTNPPAQFTLTVGGLTVSSRTTAQPLVQVVNSGTDQFNFSSHSLNLSNGWSSSSVPFANLLLRDPTGTAFNSDQLSILPVLTLGAFQQFGNDFSLSLVSGAGSLVFPTGSVNATNTGVTLFFNRDTLAVVPEPSTLHLFGLAIGFSLIRKKLPYGRRNSVVT